MKHLEILWQRLVDETGKTCDRCNLTGQAVAGAFNKLRQSLAVMDIDVHLTKEVIDPDDFLKDPLQSNRIWIAGKPIEGWLMAESGHSQCCASCGDADCRTLIIDGIVYEDIPEELILKAGLMAAASVVHTATVAKSFPANHDDGNNCCCC